jgi:hypothetical protein
MVQQDVDERYEGLSFLGLAIGSVTSVALAGTFIAMFAYQLMRGVGRVFFG